MTTRSGYGKTLVAALLAAGLAASAAAETVKVEMTVQELELQVDNKGTKQLMWTFGGTVPGPLVRVKQGDVVEFTLHNDEANKNSHSMDFHAAIVDADHLRVAARRIDVLDLRHALLRQQQQQRENRDGTDDGAHGGRVRHPDPSALADSKRGPALPAPQLPRAQVRSLAC